MPLFAYPIPIPAEIIGVSHWSRSVMLGSAESEHPKLTNGEIIVEEFQPMWSQYLNVTDGQTHDCRSNTALCVASRSKKKHKTTDRVNANKHTAKWTTVKAATHQANQLETSRQPGLATWFPTSVQLVCLVGCCLNNNTVDISYTELVQDAFPRRRHCQSINNTRSSQVSSY